MPFIHIEKKYINNGTIHYYSHNDNRFLSDSKVSNRGVISKFLKLLVSIGVLLLMISI